MKSPPAKSPKRLRFRLECVAGFFIIAAVVFTLYCGVQMGFPAGQQTQGRPGNSIGFRKRILGSGQQEDAPVLKKADYDSTEGIGVSRRHARWGEHKQIHSESPCPEAEVKTVTKVETKTVTQLVYGVSTRNDRAYHVVTTTQGFTNHWQARIHYYWYKKQREICQREPPCDMGGFTRLLHSGEADDLMDEIPTVVVDHLPDSVLKNSSYVVLNRPYAFLLWLQKVSIPEKYFLMAEADHLFLRPMPNMMNGEAAGAALFTYIVPTQYPNIVRKFIGNVSDDEVKLVPQIGNSPTIVSVQDFRKLAPIWYNTTLEIFDDDEAHSAWNWVLEMYGYALATYRAGQHVGMKVHPNMLAHPPFDKEEVDQDGRPFYILHLTYPCRYDKLGNSTDNVSETAWVFDKRAYMGDPPPRYLEPPPANVHNHLVRDIIAMINEATTAIPCWDEYVKTKKVTKACGVQLSGAR